MIVLALFGCGRQTLADSFFPASQYKFPRETEISLSEIPRALELDRVFWLEFCERYPDQSRRFFNPFSISPQRFKDTAWILLDLSFSIWPLKLPEDLSKPKHPVTPPDGFFVVAADSPGTDTSWPSNEWKPASGSFAAGYPKLLALLTAADPQTKLVMKHSLLQEIQLRIFGNTLYANPGAGAPNSPITE